MSIDKNKIEFFLFNSFVKLFNLFGIKTARHFARGLALLFFYIIPIRKKTVITNLKLAFPDLADDQIRKIALRTYRSFSLTLIEIMCIPFMSAEYVKNWVNFRKLDIIKQKYEEKKGVILLTAHYGNWELGACALGLHMNIPIYVVAKPQRNSLVGNWLNMMRESFGNKVVLLGMSFRNIFKVLYEKNIVGLVGDQRGEPDGPRVRFMGIDSTVYPGTAVLALRTKAPIVVVMTQRQPDYSFDTEVDFIDVEELEGSDEEKIIEINQRYSAILESCIRKTPEQWFWMHKRWKY